MILAAILAAAGHSGCSVSKACTLIACYNTLQVNLPPSVGPSYQAAITYSSGQVVSFACRAGGTPIAVAPGLTLTECNAARFRVFCEDGRDGCAAASVFVEVVSDAGRRAGQLATGTITSRPNGPGCEPSCLSTVATLR